MTLCSLSASNLSSFYFHHSPCSCPGWPLVTGAPFPVAAVEEVAATAFLLLLLSLLLLLHLTTGLVVLSLYRRLICSAFRVLAVLCHSLSAALLLLCLHFATSFFLLLAHPHH